MPVKRLRRVYVWELPVRFFHWLNALAITVLCVTGYLIGDPPAFLEGGEASTNYWFGTVRFIHFATAYIFMFNLAFRLYWGFVGNRYARWHNFIPPNKKFFKGMWDVLRIDIMLKKNTEHMAVGHNQMAGFIYFFTFIATVIVVITGLGLYAAMSEWWFANLFAWVPALVGGDFVLREIHHLTMWFFILFTIVHVYLVLYHDYVEGRGELSSMVGGWKFIEEDVWEDELEEIAAEKEAEKASLLEEAHHIIREEQEARKTKESEKKKGSDEKKRPA